MRSRGIKTKNADGEGCDREASKRKDADGEGAGGVLDGYVAKAFAGVCEDATAQHAEHSGGLAIPLAKDYGARGVGSRICGLAPTTHS